MLIRRLLAAVVAVMLPAGVVTLAARDATASDFVPAGITNYTDLPILVGKKWCSELDKKPEVHFYPCAGEPTTEVRWDGKWETGLTEDWDGFRVPGGCQVHYVLWDRYRYVEQQPVDRRGAGSMWVQFHGLQWVYIRGYQCAEPDAQNPTPPDNAPDDPDEGGGGGGTGGSPDEEPALPAPDSLNVKRDDYNRDGVSDLVGVRSSDGCLARWKGNGDGGLTFVGDLGCGWGGYTELTAVGDLTGDGNGDLVGVRISDGCLARWKGNGSFGFTNYGDAGCGWGAYTQFTGPGDINADGIGDLVAVRKADGCLARWKGTSTGGLVYLGTYGCGWNRYRDLTGVGDINNDGNGDLVAINNSTGCIARWMGRGTGGFSYVGTYGCGWGPYTNLVGLGDLSGDGLGDLVARRATDGHLARWSGTTRAGLNFSGDWGGGWAQYLLA